jgi:hypothetical protein
MSDKIINNKQRLELICSRDKDGNIYCAGCKTLIISKDITNDDEFSELEYKFEKKGGVVNCCYDCKFNWYCNNCSFITVFETHSFNSCGNTMMKQLLNPSYGGGRLSCTKDEDYWPYLRKFFAKDMKYGKHENPLKGKIADIKKIVEIYKGPNPEKEIDSYRKYIKKNLSEVRNKFYK